MASYAPVASAVVETAWWTVNRAIYVVNTIRNIYLYLKIKTIQVFTAVVGHLVFHTL